MSILTVWAKGNKIQLVQLSDQESDGAASQQIEYFKTLDVYSDYECVSENYVGEFPDTDSSLWQWQDGVIISSQPPAPSIVSMRQARLALLQFGVLSMVDAAIAQGSEADKITWEYAAEVDRNSPLVANMKVGLDLSDADLDGLFSLAASL